MKEKDLKFTLYLGGENISVGGQIEFLKCADCGLTLFDLDLRSDTDMVYQGVVSLVDLNLKRVVVTRVTMKEWENYEKYVPYLLQQRVNKIFNTSSFKYLVYKHFVDRKNGEKIYRKVCPTCSGYCENTGYGSFENFVFNGGQITSVDNHELSNW